MFKIGRKEQIIKQSEEASAKNHALAWKIVFEVPDATRMLLSDHNAPKALAFFQFYQKFS